MHTNTSFNSSSRENSHRWSKSGRGNTNSFSRRLSTGLGRMLCNNGSL